MKAKEVMKLLGISRVTLHRYIKQGYLKYKALPTGLYDYDDDSVYAFIGLKKDKHNTLIVSYSRVSTQEQRQQLKEQTQRIYDSCMARGLKLDKQYEDIKSGLSFDRPDFNELLKQVISGNVELVIIENKDRLSRFGFDLLTEIFKYFGCKILVLNDVMANKTYEQELTEDLISIIQHFTTESYYHRRKLNKIMKELKEDEKQHNNAED